MNDRYQTPHYILDLERRAKAQHGATQGPANGAGPNRQQAPASASPPNWQANVYGAITGCVGAFFGGWVLGWWL